MWPDRVSNPGPPTYESGALPIALRGPAKLRRHEQYYSVILAEYICYYRGHNSAIMTRMKILFPNAHVQCMSELCCKFKCRHQIL